MEQLYIFEIPKDFKKEFYSTVVEIEANKNIYDNLIMAEYKSDTDPEKATYIVKARLGSNQAELKKFVLIKAPKSFLKPINYKEITEAGMKDIWVYDITSQTAILFK